MAASARCRYAQPPAIHRILALYHTRPPCGIARREPQFAHDADAWIAWHSRLTAKRRGTSPPTLIRFGCGVGDGLRAVPFASARGEQHGVQRGELVRRTGKNACGGDEAARITFSHARDGLIDGADDTAAEGGNQAAADRD